MHIHLHLGLHKTGTSSLQQVLLDAFGASDPRPIWYPMPAAHGPGHAELAWRALGYKGRTEEVDLLPKLARAASGGECRHLILSSEEFIRAMPGKLHRLAELGAFGTLMPVVTLAPIGRRTASLWQEMLKHGHKQPLADSLEAISMRLIEVSFLEAAANAFAVPPARARLGVIVAGGADEPGILFQRFRQATGLPVPRAAADGGIPPINRSMSRLEAELLLTLAHHTDDDQFRASWPQLRAMFRSRGWQDAAPCAPIVLPPDWRGRLKRHARAAIERIRALEQSGHAIVHGDLDRLDDLPEEE
jgi:hypothetical protein